MTTTIPPTELSRILRTKPSPETIVALLNAAEATHSPSPRRSNSKRVYPFWKTCLACSRPFPCRDRYQADRNKTCSPVCAAKLLEGPRRRKASEERPGLVLVACTVCGRQVWKPRAWVKRVGRPTCSRGCNGVLRGAAWKAHAHKGRLGWTDASVASYQAKMTGPGNPAWKGGVTYASRHGLYGSVKYVRCPEPFRAMARADGYVPEHRLLVAQSLGRCLMRREVVHHDDHDPTNNTLTNLALFACNRDHKLYEAHGSPAPVWHG